VAVVVPEGFFFKKNTPKNNAFPNFLSQKNDP
jgi:hypothetical protein